VKADLTPSMMNPPPGGADREGQPMPRQHINDLERYSELTGDD
jgi:hypothetical protein